jgi:hypothetical protein
MPSLFGDHARLCEDAVLPGDEQHAAGPRFVAKAQVSLERRTVQ